MSIFINDGFAEETISEDIVFDAHLGLYVVTRTSKFNVTQDAMLRIKNDQEKVKVAAQSFDKSVVISKADDALSKIAAVYQVL